MPLASPAVVPVPEQIRDGSAEMFRSAERHLYGMPGYQRDKVWNQTSTARRLRTAMSHAAPVHGGTVGMIERPSISPKTTIDAGVAAGDAARRAGRPRVLLRVYANCIDGNATAGNRFICNAHGEGNGRERLAGSAVRGATSLPGWWAGPRSASRTSSSGPSFVRASATDSEMPGCQDRLLRDMGLIAEFL